MVAVACFLLGQPGLISIIVIHEHNIKISPALFVWESASEIIETLSLDIERDDGCAYLMSNHYFCLWVKISVLLNFHF